MNTNETINTCGCAGEKKRCSPVVNQFFCSCCDGDCDGGNGRSPYIGENGNWFEWSAEANDFVDTEVHAEGPKGENGEMGPQGPQGLQGVQGPKGDTGAQGLSPIIGDNGNWYTWSDEAQKYVDTGTNAEGTSGIGGRIMLNDDLDIFVRKDGSDQNDGLTDLSGGAFLTINAAIRSLMRFDAQGHTIKIVVHEGIYKEDIVFDQSLNSIGYKALTLMGYPGETINVTSNVSDKTILINGAKSIYFKELTITTNLNIASAYCIYIVRSAHAQCTDCKLIGKASDNWLVQAHAASNLEFYGNTTVSSNCKAVFLSSWSSHLYLSGTIHNQNISVSLAYVMAYGGSIQSLATFTGSVTGKRYEVTLNGTIDTNGGGATYFPGNVSGSTATGSVYN